MTTIDSLTPDMTDQPPRAEPERRSSPSPLSILRMVVPVVVVIGTFAVLAKNAAQPLGNTDTYFHLRFGHEFLTGAWSLTDPGSVTSFGTADWVPTQWLPQVVMAQSEEWWGLAGVAWLAGLLHISLALTLWAIARRYANALAAAPIMVVALLAASPGLSMRPQVLSYLFIALTTAAWVATRDDQNVRWWLVPLTWVWAMTHGMWPIGIIISGVALVGLALDRAVPRRRWFQLLAIPVLSAVAAALTPVGPQLYAAVLLVNSRGEYFAEWQPPTFTKPASIAFLVLAAILLLRMWRRTTPTSWTEVSLVMLAGGFALYSGRTLIAAAMMLVPFAARALQELMGSLQRVTRVERLLVVGGAVASLAVLAFVTPRTADEPPAYPEWFSALEELPPGTVVLNDWGEGGYLMWRYPDLELVMNGYGDIFTDDELARNYAMDATLPGWVRKAQETGARYALLRTGARLTYGLDELEGWKVTHRSTEFVMLEAPEDWPN